MNRQQYYNYLNSALFGKETIFFDELDSTNRYALKEELPVGTVILAEKQTSGHGRSGRVWQSDGKDLLFTVILPECNITQLLGVQLIAGFVLVDLLKQCGDFKLKWPNDIYFNGKKVAGILVETVFSGNTIKKAVLGIGLNVNAVFDSDISGTATSIYEVTNITFDRYKLLAEIINKLEEKVDLYMKGGIDIVEQWVEYSAFINKEISFHKNGVKVKMTEIGVTKEGFMIGINDKGIKETVTVGDI